MAENAPGATTASELLARSRLEQGLPPEVEDETAIEHLAVLLRASAQGAAHA